MAPMPWCPDALWDQNKTWIRTDNPNLTECMRHTVLVAVPVGVLFLFAPFWICSVSNGGGRGGGGNGEALPTARLGLLFWSKISLTAITLASVVASYLTDVLAIRSDHQYISDYIYLLGLSTALLSTVGIVVFEKLRYIHTSPLLFTFWTLLFLCSIPSFKVSIEAILKFGDICTIVETATFLPVIFLQIVLHCKSDNSCLRAPEDRASFASHLVFAWLDPIVHRGFKTLLTLDDLPESPKSIRCDANVREFLNAWRKSKDKSSSMSACPVNIFKIIFRVYRARLVWILGLSLAHVALTFVNPQVLKLIIIHVQSSDEAWKGYLYSIILLLTAILFTLTLNHSSYHLTITAIQLRNSLASAIYRKSLRLSSEAKQVYSSGEITNFIAVDSRLILDYFPWSNHIFQDPIVVVLTIIFLYAELGMSALAGVAVLLLLVPVNTYCSKKIEEYQGTILESKDQRMKTTNETINGILLLKMFTWESPFSDRINSFREKEIIVLQKLAKMFAFSNCTFSCSPIIVTLLVFGLYVFIDPVNHLLTPEKVFVSLSLFSILRLPLEVFPQSLFDAIRMYISLKRISGFLNALELDPDAVDENVTDEANAIEVEGGSFAWQKEGAAALEASSVSIKRGSLVAIVGRVGSGKSAFLSALLGDMAKRSGRVSVKGSVAYVPQKAWILNNTLKENVIFGGSTENTFYRKVIKRCGLLEDLKQLPAGQDTELGENGANLSGGQKQRISLARAVFLDRDIYLLDDPLSAVDSHVGDYIFNNVISSQSGLLRNKTRVLVTHGIHFLQHVDQIIVIDGGHIIQHGTYSDLVRRSGVFANLIKDFGTADAAATNKDDAKKPEEKETANVDEFRVVIRRRFLSQCSIHSQGDVMTSYQSVPQEDPSCSGAGGLIEAEIAAGGKVHWSVYLDYVKMIGLPYSGFILVLFALCQALHVGSTAWLSYWSDKNEAVNDDPAYHLGVFAGIGLGQVVIAFCRQVMLYVGCARASKLLHQKLLHHVIRSPMEFFDTTPTGRIVNRFSSDLDVADETLPQEISDCIWCAMEMISTVIIISVATPTFISVITVLLVVFVFIVYYYISSSRQLKRLESITRSPILSHFQETLSGVSSIRTYQCQERFVTRAEEILSENINCRYLSAIAQLWLGTRTEFLAALVIFSASLLAVVARGTISGGMAGLSITYAFEVMEALSWMVAMACNLETNSVSLERIMEYFKLPQEPVWNSSECSERWPSKGEVVFRNYSSRYRDGMDLVLSNLNLVVREKEKLGICGRTGAGKSTISKALFRIVEAAEGSIVIDGRDIAGRSLQELRSSLTVIPQDPTLFSGTLRFNLDPAHQYCDSELWRALELAHLKQTVLEMSGGGLELKVQERGENFSVGQRQLVCLARALLRKSKVLVLDEATAAVDLETDDLIQKTIRVAFADATVLTIAHRLDTIMDSDRILVLSEGKVAELDTPENLMRNVNSVFYSMAQAHGLVTK